MSKKGNMKVNQKQINNNEKFCKLFFTGGREEVQKILTEAVCKARKDMTLTELDKACFCKKDGLPSFKDVERDHSKMTYQMFCRAACVLDLNIEDVLEIKLTPDKLQNVLDLMKEDNSGLAAADGGNPKHLISNKDVAPVYARFAILSEI